MNLKAPAAVRADLASPVLEEMFQEYVEATPLGILLIDDEGAISYVNQSLCACFGYQPGELLGQPIEILVPEAIEHEHVELRNAFLKDPVQRLMVGREVQGRRKDGTVLDVAIGLNPLTRDATLKVACTVMDLTEKRQAERKLESFFQLSLDLLCVASFEGFFLRVNPSFSRLLGFNEPELLARPFLDFVHPEDAAVTQTAIEQVVSGKPVFHFRNRYLTREGGYRWIEWSGKAVPEEGVIFAIGRDMTDQIHFEKELVAKELRERAILDHTPAVVYVKQVDGKYVYINQRYAELFSLDRDAVLGKTDSEIFPRAIAEDFVQNDRQVIETANRIVCREQAPHRDGLHTYVSVKFPLCDSEGQVTAVAGMSTDITEQLKSQQLQEELQLAAAFQRKLFPEQAPKIAGLDLSGAALPVTQLCGDYYDFIVTGPQRIVIVVGDVSGHGIGPALAMVELRASLRGMLHQNSNHDLARISQKLHQLLSSDLPEGSFVSLFLAELNLARRLVRYVGAGHEAALFHAGGGVTKLASTGPVLGLITSSVFENSPPVPLGDHDVLLICTDGVTETMNRDRKLFGNRRICDCLSQSRHSVSQDIIRHLFEQVQEFAGSQALHDDITAVAAKILPATV